MELLRRLLSPGSRKPVDRKPVCKEPVTAGSVFDAIFTGRCGIRTNGLRIATAVLLTSTVGSVAIFAREPRSAEIAIERDSPFLRGMTVSCPGYGRIWGSPAMSSALAELQEIGVRSVSIHPYAGVRRDGSIRFEPAAATGYLPAAVERAKAAGVDLFWKPHLAYWGSFDWRGDIEFGDDEARWHRFFRDYRNFIVDQARFAETHRIPLFSVGLEYEKTLEHEAAWRGIIEDVRQVYSGRLTYSANWDGLEKVPFWDAVDLIGVQAYFPLSHLENPRRADIERGWEEPLERLRRLSDRYTKPVLFAEIGYDLSSQAASSPWQGDGRDTADNRALRRKLMEVALQRIEAEPFIAGMYWWKWMPGARSRGDFAMRHPEAVQMLRSAWSEPPRAR